MKERLTDQDFAKAAIRLNTGIAEIKAVTEVESGGRGFEPDGLCIIRFEPHLFSRFTKRIYDLSHPQLSYETLNVKYPSGQNQSWKLFREACTLNVKAAVMATSWGMFQILGQNSSVCGCESLTEFVAKMENSELDQLKLFCNFIINSSLDDEIRGHRWADFARVYNGKNYKINKYDVRLATAYAKHLNKKA